MWAAAEPRDQQAAPAGPALSLGSLGRLYGGHIHCLSGWFDWSDVFAYGVFSVIALQVGQYGHKPNERSLHGHPQYDPTLREEGT